MRLNTLMQVLLAAHFSYKVEGEFLQRGGIMLVAPPASLKSTIISSSYIDIHDALCLSDINIQTLIPMRDDIAGGRINTLSFLELEKIYQRHPSTASNIEGHLKAMVEEGFTNASFEDQRMQCLQARALVVGAMTPSLQRMKYTAWRENGFLRRFLWCMYQMKDKQLLMDAIDNWKKLGMSDVDLPIGMSQKSIDPRMEQKESTQIRVMLRYQPGQETPYVLMKKIFCVLRYWNRKDDNPSKKAMAVMNDFSESLRKDGAQLTL